MTADKKIICEDCRWWRPGFIEGEDNFIPPRCTLHDAPMEHDRTCSDAKEKAKTAADERIEKLLNRFGQTISDLPDYYQLPARDSASRAAFDFYTQNGMPERPWLPFMVNQIFICHLCDVIDRLEIALETASRWMPCYLCKNASECSKKGMEDLHCVRPCDEKTINDYMLHDQ